MTELEIALIQRVQELEQELATLRSGKVRSKKSSQGRREQQDRATIKYLKGQYPDATLRQIAAIANFGKDNVAAIIRELEQEGAWR